MQSESTDVLEPAASLPTCPTVPLEEEVTNKTEKDRKEEEKEALPPTPPKGGLQNSRFQSIRTQRFVYPESVHDALGHHWEAGAAEWKEQN